MLGYTPDWDYVSTANGYRVVRCVGHPRAWKKGHYVYVHVVVAEQKLGRLLVSGEVVHHRDGNILNNSPDNVVVQLREDHVRLHHKGPSYSVLVCAQCGVQFKRRTRRVVKGRPTFCSRHCSGVHSVAGREIMHGTVGTYNNRKCRCAECRAAKAAAHQKRKARLVKRKSREITDL